MPVLPQYDSQVSARVGVPDSPVIKPSPVYGAIANVADQGAAYAVQEQKQRQATELVSARLRAAQGLADLQIETERQPWSEQQKFFEGRAQGMLSDLSKGFSDQQAASAFQEQWQSLYLPKRIDVMRSAYAGEKSFNRANLDQSIDTFAGQIATASTEQQAGALSDQAVSTIADFSTSGWITPEEAQSSISALHRRTDQNRARILIDQNPTSAMQALQDPQRFAGLRAEDRIALQERADSKMQHLMAVSDHNQIVAERNRKLAGDQLAKEGEDLIASGKMTEDWMQAHRTTLDPSDYRILRHAMQEGGGADSAPVMSDILKGIYADGTDQSPTILGALQARQITAQTAKSLLDDNKTSAPTPVIQARSFITQYLKPSEILPNVTQAQSFAEAMAEFNRRITQDPKQDPMALARDVVKRNSISNTQDMSLVMPLPQYFNGSRGDATGSDHKAVQALITQADLATTKAFMEKHHGDATAVQHDPEYLRQTLLIKQWNEQLAKQIAIDNATRAAPGGGLK